MIKLFTKTPDLLLPRQYVKFTGKDFTDEIKEGDMFKVVRTQQVSYEQSFILPPGDFTQIDLSSESATSLGLYPMSTDTLYEILVGIKASEDIITYIQVPAGKYFARLEKPELFPNPLTPQLRYIGHIDESKTPYKEPKLRIHTVKDLEPVVFQLYNDGSRYGKIVYTFLVNRCQIERIQAEEAATIDVYREIQHYEALRW